MSNPRIARRLAAAVLLLAACDSTAVGGPGSSGRPYEVWLVDQANSAGQGHGGTLHVFPDSALATPTSIAMARPAASIDLGGATASLCTSATGAAPVRPHYLQFNRAGTHAVLSFVGSGHVVVFDAASRAPVACLRMSAGAGGARQAHASHVAPDDSYILVANQNGKLVERIDSDFRANRFTHTPAATLDLAACAAPDGTPCQGSARPDNAPIIPVPTAGGTLAFVTLRGGGLLVIDPRATPMTVRAAYANTQVRAAGLAAVEANGSMLLSSGNGFSVYRLPLAGYGGPAAPPAPATLVSDPAPTRDAHGMAAVGRYVWVSDRGTNLFEAFDVATGARSTVTLTALGVADPAPDLVDVAPDGDLLFFSARGIAPLTGGPIATGSSPGLGVVRIGENGRTGTLLGIARVPGGPAFVTVADAGEHAHHATAHGAAPGATDRVAQAQPGTADPHAIAVRRR